MLEILRLILGPLETNTYLVADSETNEAVVIDPAWDGQGIASEAQKRNWRIGQIWVTHGHFDHIGGIGDLSGALENPPTIALHPADRFLWRVQGGILPAGHLPTHLSSPNLDLEHGMQLQLGSLRFEVRHTPGHTPGHCVFYCADSGVCFCGDLIFQNSVGRTDLPGGDWKALGKSIRSKVYTLPDPTRLLAGHEPETTVGHEKRSNPFVRA